MRYGRFLTAAAATAVYVAVAGTGSAWSDGGGNVATGSVGTAQVGSTGSTPSVNAGSVLGSIVLTVPVRLSGRGGNTADHAKGTVQLGGGNSTTGSRGTAQVSSIEGTPQGRADTWLVHVALSSPVGIPGSGPHSATDSTLTAQVGSGDSTQNSVARVRVSDVNAGLGVVAGLGDGSLVSIGMPGQPSFMLHLGDPALVVQPGFGLEDQYTLQTDTATLQAAAVGVSPATYFALDPILALAFGGWIGTGPNAGNSATSSLGTGQVGSVAVAPTLGVDLTPVDSSLTLGGSSGVDGAGTNTADTSKGTAQAGGGNVADGSLGTVQVGGVTLGQTLGLTTPLGLLRLGPGSGIAGGSNSANGSRGTVQIGGGNAADGSNGTAQLGQTTLAPVVSLAGTPVGDLAVGGTSGVAGNGNDASGSTGTAQAGGGNTATGSQGSGQSSGITLGPTVTLGNTPVGNAATDTPVDVGQGSGNTATSSTGVAQVGGGNTATDSAGVVQTCDSCGSGNQARVLSSTPITPVGKSGGTPAATPSTVVHTVAGAPKTPSASGVLHTPSKTKRTTGTLPFTGLDLLYAVLLGTLLTAAGLRLRAHGRSR